MYLIIDQKAMQGQPTSKFLTNEEIKTSQRKLNFIFRYNKTLEVEEGIAYALIEKYDTVKIVDENLEVLSIKDDLDELKLNQLRHLCKEYNIRAYQMSNVKMRMAIRKARRDGIERKPLTLEDVHEEKKQKLRDWEGRQ